MTLSRSTSTQFLLLQSSSSGTGIKIIVVHDLALSLGQCVLLRVHLPVISSLSSFHPQHNHHITLHILLSPSAFFPIPLFLIFISFYALRMSDGPFFLFHISRSTLDHATMLSLLRSRCSGNSSVAKSLLLFYSQIVGDYDTLVTEYMSEGNYRAAIGNSSFSNSVLCFEFIHSSR